jgi:hypothetical protein
VGPFANGWDEAKIEAVLARGDADEVLYVPIVISLDPPDCAWSSAICKQLATHADARVRGNAILGFGHLARTCGALGAEIGPLIEAAHDDPDQFVRGQAFNAACDVNHFLGWTLRVPD